MKSYLSLIPISAKVHRRQNRMTLLCIIFSVFMVTAIFSMAEMGARMEQARLMEKHGNLSLQELQNPEKTAYAQIYDRLLEIFPLSQSEYGGGNCRLHSKNICGSEQNQNGTDITGGSSATEDAMCRE